jgi:hypothetical protein
VSGGSDFHGDDPAAVPNRARRGVLGVVSLPPADFAALELKARTAR